jgi:hypothetical protein
MFLPCGGVFWPSSGSGSLHCVYHCNINGDDMCMNNILVLASLLICVLLRNEVRCGLVQFLAEARDSLQYADLFWSPSSLLFNGFQGFFHLTKAADH